MNSFFKLFFAIFFCISLPFAQSSQFLTTEQRRQLLELPPPPSPLKSDSLVDFNLPQNFTGITVIVRPMSPVALLGGSIFLQIEVRNNAPSRETFRFNYNKTYFQQIDLKITDEQGGEPFKTTYYEAAAYLSRNPSLIGGSIRSLAPDERMVAIDHGQSFTMVVDASEYYDFQQEGIYYVETTFYPLSNVKTDYMIKGVPTQFQLDYSKMGDFLGVDTDSPTLENRYTSQEELTNVANFAQNSAREMQGQLLAMASQQLGPDKVVETNLFDQQKKNWQNFLLSFHLPALLQNSYPTTDYGERYGDAQETEKPIVVEDFAQFLVDSIDYEVTGFEVLKTTIIGDKAKVEVMISSVESYVSELEFFNPVTGQVENEWLNLQGDTLERERIFIYDLELFDEGWKIISIDTRVVEPGIVRQAETFEEEPVRVVENAEQLGYIYFASDSFEIASEYLVLLDEAIELLASDETVRVLLIGYTDERGTDDYNLRLSTARVQAARAYLLERGIGRDRISTDARGEIKIIEDAESRDTRLSEENLSETQLQRNRRVEIYFTR